MSGAWHTADVTRRRPGARETRAVLPVATALFLLASAALPAQTPAPAQPAVVSQPLPPETTAVLRGRVHRGGAPIAEATIRAGDSLVTRSGADGTFRLSLAGPRPTAFTVTAVGYRSRTLPLPAVLAEPVDIALEPAVVPLAPIVATGTLRETRVAESPVKVDVIGEAFLRRAAGDNLLMAMDRVTGVQQQVDCGVCFTNSLRINGMEGPYTAVLVDGVPIMSSLASVYGLQGLHPAIIEQVEIVKGPASTLYGAEAMAGVINVVTKDARYAPAFSIGTLASSHGELSAEASAAPRVGGGRLLLSGTVGRNTTFVDANADGFTDLPLVTRGALFAKFSDGPASARRLDVAVRLTGEDRFGGVRGWTRADRLGTRVYGEQISTRRAEATAQWRLPVTADLRLQAGGAWHDQNSAYGTTPYVARQVDAFTQLTLGVPAGRRHDLLAGAAFRWQRFDDDTPATTDGAVVRPVPGVFSQLESRLGGGVTTLAGLRLDHQPTDGLVAAPRFSVKWQAPRGTTLRLNAATGFRPVNIFTEDHAALSGSRRVVLAETLRPERSWTVTAGVVQPVPFRGGALTVEADLFRTEFSNRITPDYDTNPDEIRYANSREGARMQGVSLALALSPGAWPLALRVGGTWQSVQVEREGVLGQQVFSPRFKGEWTVAWEVGGGTQVDWTGRVLGAMPLPRHPDRAEQSPLFSEHAVQVTQPLGGTTALVLAVRNLFDFRQRDPLVAPEDPFGPAFDTNFVWGPTQGRRVLVGLQVIRPR